jgi:hypothetical protein
MSFSADNSFTGVTLRFHSLPPFTLYNFYSPGRPIAFVSLIKSFIPANPAIIMGDINAHHEWWYEQLPLPAGSKEIAHWFSNQGLQFMNPVGIPTHCPHNTSYMPSIIDLVLMRGKVGSYIQICNVKTSSPSDHMALELRPTLPQSC